MIENEIKCDIFSHNPHSLEPPMLFSDIALTPATSTSFQRRSSPTLLLLTPYVAAHAPLRSPAAAHALRLRFPAAAHALRLRFPAFELVSSIPSFSPHSFIFRHSASCCFTAFMS